MLLKFVFRIIKLTLAFYSYCRSSKLIEQPKNEHLILLNQIFKEIFNHFSKLNLEAITLFRYFRIIIFFRILIGYQSDIHSKDRFFRDINDMSFKLFEQILNFLIKYLNERNISKIMVPENTLLSFPELLKFVDDEFVSEVKI